MNKKIEYVKIKKFLKEWEEHHTLSRNLVDNFEYVFREYE